MEFMPSGDAARFATPASGAERPAPQSGNEPGRDLSSLKVMVVDDEFLAAWHLQAMLEDMGVVQVELAHDGPSALTLAGRFEPDLVLMDMNLGAGIDGAETARRLLQRRPVRMIFITAYGDAPTLERIHTAAPAAHVLTKPANPARLHALVAGPPAH
ncbi:MAG: response regulator [Phenylobacterium sp.]